jgi:uncharacterized integral membrane protein
MGKLIFLLLFAVLLAIFASQNTSLVHLEFLGWKSHEVSLALIIILSAALGAIASLIASLPVHHRRQRALRAKSRELEELRQLHLPSDDD